LFKFKVPQKIVQIGKMKIGGQPGILPTLLVGSLFYQNHKIVTNPKLGLFDREKAEELINQQDEFSELTGNPCAIDVVCTSIESAFKFVNYVADNTDAPIMIDIWKPEIKLKILEHIANIGLADRIIYNSLMSIPHPKEDEIEAIKESGVTAALLLCYNIKDRTAKGVLSLLKGTKEKKGLLKIAKEAGIDKPLIDTTIFTYIPSIGVGARACFLVKNNLGLPVGGSPGNATTVWKKPKQWDVLVHQACKAAAQIVPLTVGADFLLYGPIESAPQLFPACAAVDAMVATVARSEFGIKTLTKEHPLYKLFPEFVEKLEKVAL
jgi:tetrahydromethanopterin S-methyltransferase subunit H